MTIALASEGRTSRDVRVRVMTIIAAVALVLAAFVLIQQPAEAAPAKASVAASVAGAAVSSVSSQLGSACGVVLSIFNAFRNVAFLAFVLPILSGLLAFFGCPISGG